MRITEITAVSPRKMPGGSSISSALTIKIIVTVAAKMAKHCYKDFWFIVAVRSEDETEIRAG